MKFEQYKINEDDSTYQIIHKIHEIHDKYRPTGGMKRSDLDYIRQHATPHAVPDINYLVQPADDGQTIEEVNSPRTIKMYKIIMYLICDELLRTPDELEDINEWKDIVWYVEGDAHVGQVFVELLSELATPNYSTVLKEMKYSMEQIEYPTEYKELRKFDL